MPSPCNVKNPIRQRPSLSVTRYVFRGCVVLALLALAMLPSASRAQKFDPFKDAAKGKLPVGKSGAKGKNTGKPTNSKPTSKNGKSVKRTSTLRARPRPAARPVRMTSGPAPKASPRPKVSPKTPPTPATPPALTPPEKPYAGQTYKNPRDGAIMVWVPGGTFLMGTDDRTAQRDERPAVAVELTGFWMYKYPVTVAQYRKFAQATGHSMPEAPKWEWQDDYPMVDVSWNDARAYCKWAGIELPTEAQWEYAARGPDSRLYPWGNEFDPGRLWYSDKGRQSPGSTLRPENISESPFGILDMVGNVWQWCQDYYDKSYYHTAPPPKNPRDRLRNPQRKDPRGPNFGPERVLRGGSWTFRSVSASDFFQASRRYLSDPDKANAERGFRGVFMPQNPP